jgi:hypothetical protein
MSTISNFVKHVLQSSKEMKIGLKKYKRAVAVLTAQIAVKYAELFL